jgi:hypothetical protein
MNIGTKLTIEERQFQMSDNKMISKEEAKRIKDGLRMIIFDCCISQKQLERDPREDQLLQHNTISMIIPSRD